MKNPFHLIQCEEQEDEAEKEEKRQEKTTEDEIVYV
jgi:hypothetical protein